MDEFGTLSPNDDLYQPSYSQLARNRAAGAADRPGYSRLGSALGSMLFGSGLRDARTDKVYSEAAQGQVKLEDLIMKARKDRDAEIGRQGMIQKALDSGRSDIADMIRNSPDAASAGEAQLREQSRGWGEKSWDLANSPAGATDEGLELQARQAAVRAPASMKDLTKIEGGLGINPFHVPGNQADKFETPESMSMGRAHDAAAKASEASARHSDASTAFEQGPHTNAENALTEQRKRAPAGRAGNNLTDGELKIYFSDDAGGTDRKKAAEFQTFMLDNDLTDERKALRLWLKANPEKAPPEAAAPVEEPSALRSLFNKAMPPQMRQTLFGGLGTDVAKAFDTGGGKVQGAVGDSPYPEGTRLKKGGQVYVVKNGKPVLEGGAAQ